MAIDFSTLDFSWINTYETLFIVIVEIYFVMFGLINIAHALNSRKHCEKEDSVKCYKNEILIGILFLAFTFVYPFVFQTVENDYVRAQMYFHIFDSLTVHILCWMIAIPIWRWNDRRKNRHITYEDWKAKMIKDYKGKNDVKADFMRKIMHISTVAGFIALFFIDNAIVDILEPYGWNHNYFTLFWMVALGFQLLWTMNISDLLRLNKFEYLGKFARGWAEDAIKPSELDTYTSASSLLLGWLPFAIFGLPFLFAACFIGELSDAMASLVGKKFGKKRNPNSSKTIEGFIAGALTTYLLVILVNVFVPFPGVSMGIVHLMGIGAAIIFLLFDIYANVLTDNFYNPFFVGLTIWLIWLVFV
jgi:dolichol kinase